MARNKFSGVCYECGRIVQPGTGHFEKIRDAKLGARWRVKHAIHPGHGRMTCAMVLEAEKLELAKVS